VAYYVFAAVTAIAAVVTALLLESKASDAQAAPMAEQAPQPGAA
jgi:hypothetical protein